MKKLLAICAVSLLVGIGAVTAGQDREGNEDIRDRFAGAWRLAWLEQQGADGKPHRIDRSGMLVYTRDGHMSVQVIERNPQAQTPVGPEQYSQAGYEASWGTYKVDERAHTFTFHVEGAQVQRIVPIPGTRKLERLDEHPGAVSLELTPHDLREFDIATSKIKVQGARGTGQEQYL